MVIVIIARTMIPTIVAIVKVRLAMIGMLIAILVTVCLQNASNNNNGTQPPGGQQRCQPEVHRLLGAGSGARPCSGFLSPSLVHGEAWSQVSTLFSGIVSGLRASQTGPALRGISRHTVPTNHSSFCKRHSAGVHIYPSTCLPSMYSLESA